MWTMVARMVHEGQTFFKTWLAPCPSLIHPSFNPPRVGVSTKLAFMMPTPLGLALAQGHSRRARAHPPAFGRGVA